MTAATQKELAEKCIESALCHLGGVRQQWHEGSRACEAEPALLEAMAGLEAALALVRIETKPDIRAVLSEPSWIERKYDSQRR